MIIIMYILYLLIYNILKNFAIVISTYKRTVHLVTDLVLHITDSLTLKKQKWPEIETV